MPIQWKAKSANEVIGYEWEPSLADGDGLQTYSLTVSAGTVVIDSESLVGDAVVVYISGGANGETARITATAVTNDGDEIEEAIYLPVRAKPNAFTYTVRDVCNYALRPIIGLNGSPSASELADAQENLDDMLALWAGSGAELGVKLPTDANDILYVSDASLQGIKSSLRMKIGEVYGKPVDQVTALSAMRGLQQIKAALLPVDREGVDYF